MTTCQTIRELLGPYLDDEATPSQRAQVESHLLNCDDCADQLDELRSLAATLRDSVPVTVPRSLWGAIERRLEAQPAGRLRFLDFMRSRSFLAAAASIAVFIGLGLFTLHWSGTRSAVEASTVDFAVLLDSLQHDAVGAFENFLSKYQAVATTPVEAKRFATELSFDLPLTLPGGFILQKTYRLRFGDKPGVAAQYSRNGEFLGVIFHAPVLREHFGTHKDRDCVVGKHRGHRVPVGEWSLVHLTDPTTCHCVLSRLDESTELPAVMAAVAPRSALTNGEMNNHHSDSP